MEYLSKRALGRSALVLFASLWLALAGPCYAAVEITFYSKEFGSSFPHAFVAVSGTDDQTGEPIAANYGFTATHISPAILMGAVKGSVMSVDSAYQKNSDAHFTLQLTDVEYRQVLATVEKWRTRKQPSYSLNRQNCVYFVADVAMSLGMSAETPKRLMKKPRSYLAFLTHANREWLVARGASNLR